MDRQGRVRFLYDEGFSQNEIAARVGVNRQTVASDLDELGLTLWSNDVTRDALVDEVRAIILNSHPSIGRRMVESRLFWRQGWRVQRWKIEEALEANADIRVVRMHNAIKRRAFFNGVGPMFVACMDQNEKLVRWKIFFLQAVDGFTRYPLEWIVTTSLRGRAHSQLMHNVLRNYGESPAHWLVDGASQWSGVQLGVESLFGPDAPRSRVEMGDGEPPIFIERFQRTTSVHNIPVERSWRELNDITRMWAARFEDLERAGLLVGGRYYESADLFCLHAVFFGAVTDSASEHFQTMRLRKKSKSTRSPFFPEGTHRPNQLMIDLPSYGVPVSDEEIGEIEERVSHYWDEHESPNPPPWEVDPLQNAGAQQERADTMATMNFDCLEAEYVAFRDITWDLLQRGGGVV